MRELQKCFGVVGKCKQFTCSEWSLAHRSSQNELNFSKLMLFKEPSAIGKILIVHITSTELQFKMSEL